MKTCFEVNNSFESTNQIYVQPGYLNNRENIFRLNNNNFSFEVMINNGNCASRNEVIHICCEQIQNISLKIYSSMNVVGVVFLGALRPILSKFDNNEVEKVDECPLEYLINTVTIDRRMCRKQPAPLIRFNSTRGKCVTNRIMQFFMPFAMV